MTDIYKANVYDPSENKIGDVTDLMIDPNGNVTGAIIGVGGFLGVDKKSRDGGDLQRGRE